MVSSNGVDFWAGSEKVIQADTQRAVARALRPYYIAGADGSTTYYQPGFRVQGLWLANFSNVQYHVLFDTGYSLAIPAGSHQVIIPPHTTQMAVSADSAGSGVLLIAAFAKAPIPTLGGWNVGGASGAASNVTIVNPLGTASKVAVEGAGTAGASVGGVLSVQGVGGGTAIPVSFAANQSINEAQIGGVAYALGGALPAASAPVILAKWSGNAIGNGTAGALANINGGPARTNSRSLLIRNEDTTNAFRVGPTGSGMTSAIGLYVGPGDFVTVTDIVQIQIVAVAGTPAYSTYDVFN